jgi:hypothetical protein
MQLVLDFLDLPDWEFKIWDLLYKRVTRTPTSKRWIRRPGAGWRSTSSPTTGGSTNTSRRLRMVARTHGVRAPSGTELVDQANDSIYRDLYFSYRSLATESVKALRSLTTKELGRLLFLPFGREMQSQQEPRRL